MTALHYASDELVRVIQNGGSALSSAAYVYVHDEADENFYAIIHEMNWIMTAIPALQDLRGTLKFAVVAGSTSPFQVSRIAQDTFVILVDQRAFYYLITLCLTVQALPPICEEINTREVLLAKNYTGKFLLDITKDIAFHSDDVSGLLGDDVHRSVYQAALTYIIGHEIAHVSHGHLEFKASDDFSLFCQDNEDRDLTLRTLEMDADSSGTSSVFDVFERMIVNLKDQRELSPDQENMIRMHYILGIYLACIYHDTLITNFSPSKYPGSYARYLTAQGVIEKIFASRVSDLIGLPEKIRSLLVEAFIRISGKLENLGHPIASNVLVYEEENEPKAIYDPIGILAGQAELDPLHGRWARLRPYLEQFHRGGKLAPPAAEPY